MDTESVRALLQATRSSERDERMGAESRVGELAVSAPSAFLPALLAVAEHPQFDVADRQSAMLAFKTCVQKFWSPGFEQFTGPPFSHELRAQLRSELLKVLVTVQDHKVRTACALVIGQIGSLEYPDQWPDLVGNALQFLSAPIDSQAISAGLTLFKELLIETFREEDFTVMGEPICNRLMSIVQYGVAQQAHQDTTLSAMQCFHECVTFLLMGDDDQLPHLDEIAGRIVPQWVETLCGVLRVFPRSNSLVNEVQNTLREMDSAFPELMEPQLPQVYMVVTHEVLPGGSTPPGVACDAATAGYADLDFDQDLLSNFSLLLIMVLNSTSARNAVFRNAGELELLCGLLLQMSVLSAESQEVYLSDYNVFVTDELELGSGGLSPRTNAAALVSMTSQPHILNTLVDMLAKAAASAAHTDQSVAQQQLRVLEACLFLISSALSQIDLAASLPLMQATQLQTLLGALEFSADAGEGTSYPASDSDAAAGAHLLLTARKMVTASFTAKYCGSRLPENIRTVLATHCCRLPGIVSPETSNVLKCAALRGFSVSAVPSLYSYLVPFQSVGLQLVYELLSSDPDDDTPSFLAETYGSVLKIDYKVVERRAECVQILLALAALDSSDIELNAQILDVVGELLDAVSQRQVVDSILRPVLALVERKGAETQFSYSGELYFALELLSTILSNSQVNFNINERVEMMNSFYHCITTTDDPQILQVASFAYAALIRDIDTTGPQQIDANTAQNVLKVAARLLSPDLDDSAALASGKLVCAIIDQFGDSLGELLQELLVACAKRLTSAKNALLVETLVMVFCELTLRNSRAVVDILSEFGMLEQVMGQWIPTFEVTIGADNIRKQIKALQLLFELQDPRLEELMVPDEPIRKPGEVMTRRRAANIQFTQVSVPVKILKLLIRELSQASPDQPQPTKIGNNSDDDEWDDELVITEEGEFFDQVAYGLIVNWLKRLSQQPGMMEYYGKLNAAEQEVLSRSLQ